MPSTAGTQVGELVRVLALGWKNLAAYPPGHPALAGSLDLIHRRLNELRGPGGDVVFGIARDGLIYGKEKIDSTGAQKFAQALYTRGVAILRFETLVEPRDIETFLRLLASPPAAATRPIWEELTATGVIHIHLQPVDFTAISVTDDLTPKPKPESRSLWEEILRALAAGRELSKDGEEILSREVRSIEQLTELVAEFLQEASETADVEFDPRATFGVRLTARVPGVDSPERISERVAEAIGLYVSAAGPLKKQLVVQQLVQLLRSLPDPMRGMVMRSVLRALATDPTAAAPLRDFTSALSLDEVLDTLRYLATMTRLSDHAIRLMEMLVPIESPAAHPDPPTPQVIADLVHLFAEEDIDRFNPEDHRALLDRVSVRIPELSGSMQGSLEQLGDRVDSITDDALNQQLTRSLLELLSTYGSSRPPYSILNRLQGLFRLHLSSGQYADAITVIDGLQATALITENPALAEAIHDAFDTLSNTEMIGALIETLHSAPPRSLPTIHRLLEAMGTAATKSLLLALAEESNRSRRRRLFDFVSSLGTVFVTDAAHFLADSRWFVVRNMILLLRSVNDRTTLPEIRKLAHHPDLRVRMEAIKTLIALEPAVPRALLEEAIHDRDPKLAETAIALVGNYGIKEGIDPLLGILRGNDWLGLRRSLRLKAIKALGELAEPSVLPRMQRFFSSSFLPWPSEEERHAAYESLAGYPAENRVDIVEKGLHSRDPYIRDVCSRLMGS
jgi:hypothetical protein